jgi:hypothetical protein
LQWEVWSDRVKVAPSTGEWNAIFETGATFVDRPQQ